MSIHGTIPGRALCPVQLTLSAQGCTTGGVSIASHSQPPVAKVASVSAEPQHLPGKSTASWWTSALSTATASGPKESLASAIKPMAGSVLLSGVWGPILGSKEHRHRALATLQLSTESLGLAADTSLVDSSNCTTEEEKLPSSLTLNPNCASSNRASLRRETHFCRHPEGGGFSPPDRSCGACLSCSRQVQHLRCGHVPESILAYRNVGRHSESQVPRPFPAQARQLTSLKSRSLTCQHGARSHDR